MSLAIAHSRASLGIEAPPVTVEIHIANGLPSLSIVGLPETAVKESKDRVRSAIINSGFEFPLGRITINLAPAELPKEGGRFDLPIALGILAASGQIAKEKLAGTEFYGELALSGELRITSGLFPALMQSITAKGQLVIPYDNLEESRHLGNPNILGATSLLQVAAYLVDGKPLPELKTVETQTTPAGETLSIDDIQGQEQAKRALIVAATAGHSLLMQGPPGSGKTMLAKRLPTLLPRLATDHAMETASIYSLRGMQRLDCFDIPPFRAPHHTASAVALVGGGSHPKPGEISLAHHGVLFLDELPEFQRKVLEALREPLEEKHVTISRAAHQMKFPARFQLIAAMNPCPCGYHGDTQQPCRCTPAQIGRYRGKISGPILDRIDMHIEVPRIPADILIEKRKNQNEHAEICQRLSCARELQYSRQGKLNAQLSQKELGSICTLDKKEHAFVQSAIRKLNLSARAYYRVLRLARTLADLEQSLHIQKQHLAEALQYRRAEACPTGAVTW